MQDAIGRSENGPPRDGNYLEDGEQETTSEEVIIIEEDMEEELSVAGSITQNEPSGIDKIAEVNDIDSFLRDITVENRQPREPTRVADDLTMVQSGNASESMRALHKEAPGVDDEYYDYFVEEEEEEELGVFKKVTKAAEVSDKVSQ